MQTIILQNFKTLFIFLDVTVRFGALDYVGARQFNEHVYSPEGRNRQTVCLTIVCYCPSVCQSDRLRINMCSIQAVRVATQYAPPLSSPRGRPSPLAPPSRRNVAVLSHAEYVPTLTAAAALRVKAALSKAAWWPWPFDLEGGVTSRVTWAICVPILVFLGLSVLELFPMYATDVRRQTDVRQKHCLMPPP